MSKASVLVVAASPHFPISRSTGLPIFEAAAAKPSISLYTNGIFPESWEEGEFETLVRCLDKLRFSIDAADAQEWSNYKGRPPEFFETLWKNIGNVVASRRRTAGAVRLGASCIVSNFTYRNVETFLVRARDTGLDFCDIKAVETCFGEKAEYKATSEEFREIFAELMTRIRNGFFAPLDVVVDDSLLSQDENTGADDVHPKPLLGCDTWAHVDRGAVCRVASVLGRGESRVAVPKGA